MATPESNTPKPKKLHKRLDGADRQRFHNTFPRLNKTNVAPVQLQDANQPEGSQEDPSSMQEDTPPIMQPTQTSPQGFSNYAGSVEGPLPLVCDCAYGRPCFIQHYNGTPLPTQPHHDHRNSKGFSSTNNEFLQYTRAEPPLHLSQTYHPGGGAVAQVGHEWPRAMPDASNRLRPEMYGSQDPRFYPQPSPPSGHPGVVLEQFRDIVAGPREREWAEYEVNPHACGYANQSNSTYTFSSSASGSASQDMSTANYSRNENGYPGETGQN